MYFPATFLLLLPAYMGFAFIWLGILYTNQLRLLVFDLAWVGFAAIFVLFAFFSKAPISKVVRSTTKSSAVAFGLLAGILIYTSIFVAIDVKAATHVAGTGLLALSVGLASVALKERFGDQFSVSISWALFGAMLLHIPFLIWIYILEGQNLDFAWNYSLPGFTGVRPYNYLVEAGIAAGIGLYYTHRHGRSLPRCFLWVGSVALWAALFWSGGRGGFFALALTIGLVAIVVPQIFAKLWKFVALTAIAGAGISLLLPSPGGGFGLIGRIERTFGAGSLNGASSGRLNMWSESIDLFLQKPFFGHGISQYPHLTKYPGLTAHSHVHNILLDALMSFGVVGAAALIFLLGKIFVAAVFDIRQTKSAIDLPMFLVASTLLAHGFVSGTYFHVHSQILIAISLGLLVYIGNHGREKPTIAA